ncbi:biotin synthase BioB [Clostridium sp. FP2]|uniref:biotin synthase BioB n=1 Tax=Clostridium TaxID=1485 RepID=UPI0013E903EC|nr:MULTISPECIES: biotin synthase BioB [Clostridium]MBW9157182.1 biotin synthase BioB [Clostridium tagluense]MBZ9623038.1 biotin synthase BioB [Clostridium sp. FP2]WLC67214.1 biotin synthase BioB [Clostridium tagluense]
MKEFIKSIEKNVLSGQAISFEEAIELTSIAEKEDIVLLCNTANKVRGYFCGREVDLCSIMNAKSGRCTEDCKFCAQSAHYNTNVEEYGLVSKEDALKLAKENENEGVNRFSLVTSGRGPTESDFEKILHIYEELNKEIKMDLCASLGILGYEQLLKLKESGITMYHHNLETSREYYENICTTHSYDERLDTINAASRAGMLVCSGGIIGLGESFEDRIKLAFLLRDLGVKSIPINVLNPIEGTPLEKAESLNQEEILKTIAIFRLVNPKALIRLAGGRNRIDEFGKNCFDSGANATITGNYLTTSGNKICDDKKMVSELNLEVRKNG